MSQKVFVHQELQKAFPTARIKSEGNSVKAHFRDLNKFELDTVIKISDDYDTDLGIKRSGTGITVLLTLAE